MPFIKWRHHKQDDVNGKEKSKRGEDQRSPGTEQQTISDDDVYIVYLSYESPKKTVLDVLKAINNNEIQLVQTEEDCVDRIKSMSDKKIFLILENPPSQTLLESLNTLTNVDSVIVYSSSFNKSANETDQVQNSRVITRCENPESLLNTIQSVRNDLAKQTAAFSVYNQNEKSTRDLSKESGSFMFFQLLKSVLMNMPKTQEAKQMMVDKCKEYYRGNLVELANINEFDLTYKSDEAIQWYTKECFLYRFINKALRTENVNVLYHFRFYIIDLCKQLDLKFEDLKTKGKNLIKLYRGLCLSPTES
ncbi:hypothetical protein I4U23_031225 [Adineta vaga]|nr:hypothetical protein I4U23_031225 [Adineta vaga]